jgi:hypothetical protein
VNHGRHEASGGNGGGGGGDSEGGATLSSLIPAEMPAATRLAADLSGAQRAAMLEALLTHRAREKVDPKSETLDLESLHHKI